MTEAEREALELWNGSWPGMQPLEFEQAKDDSIFRIILTLVEERNALRADMAEIDRIAVALLDISVTSFSRANGISDIASLAAKHRAEPDPLVEEARKLVAARYPASETGMIGAVLRGEDDDSQAVQNCLAALKRGIELARKENDDAR